MNHRHIYFTLFITISIITNYVNAQTQFETKEELQTAVDMWIDDNETALTTYGTINTWDVSLITDMSDLFKLKTTFNDDISNWDVSNVINMSEMFENAEAFNINISAWDVSSVTDMGAMFNGATSFNGDISTWDVSSVTDMSYLFSNASNFNQDISNWDVSSVTIMSRMFAYADAFNGDISSWDVSSVTRMSYMFYRASSFNGNISTWDVSSVTNMEEMFGEASSISDANKCAIHTSFSSNANWPYDWADYCESSGCTDQYADNYDPDAIVDDGNCSGYPDNGEYNLSFDGDDDYVEIPDNELLSSNGDDFSVLVKFNCTDISQNRGIVTKYYDTNTKDWGMWIDEGSNLHLDFESNGNNFWINLDDIFLESNQDYAIGFSFNYQTKLIKVYIDGNEVASETLPVDDLSDTNEPISIGRNGGVYNSNYFQGIIDDLTIWNTVVTSNEIQSHMNGSLTGEENGLVGLWKFDAGDGTMAYDHSGSLNHGTINGASWGRSLTHVPGDNFEQALIDLGYDGTLDNYVVTDSINSVTSLDVVGREISDLTGIEDFKALEELSCSNNQLTTLDVSNNKALTSLGCGNNLLTELDVSNNTALWNLQPYGNQLTALDVSNHTALEKLRCHDNELTSLNLTGATALYEVFCYNNQLTALDVSTNTALEDLLCDRNQLTTLDVSNNTYLTRLHCYTNSLTSLSVSGATALTALWCYNNQLEALDVSTNTALTHLYCYNNELTELPPEIGNLIGLTELLLGGNRLDELPSEIGNLTNLTELFLEDNQLKELPGQLEQLTDLSILYLYGNELGRSDFDFSRMANLTHVLIETPR